MKKIFTLIVILSVVLFACKNNNQDKQAEDTVDLDALMRDTMTTMPLDTGVIISNPDITVNTENAIISHANSVLEAIHNKNYKKLSTYIDPQKGVVFSPYAYVDESVLKENHFTKQSIISFGESKNKKLWGYADGSGDPINMTMGEYIDRYVYDNEFLHVKNIRANQSLFKKSNGVDNSLKYFPGKTFVDYYKKPKEGETEFDWSNLRLIFNQEGNNLYLIAVVHHQWQI